MPIALPWVARDRRAAHRGDRGRERVRFTSVKRSLIHALQAQYPGRLSKPLQEAIDEIANN